MIVIIAAAVAFAVAGYLLLPDVLVLQITASGEAGNTMRKLPGLAISFLISVIFAIWYERKGEKKFLIAALVGLLMSVLTFLFNLG